MQTPWFVSPSAVVALVVVLVAAPSRAEDPAAGGRIPEGKEWSIPEELEETEFKAGEAKGNSYSCRRYHPVQDAVYLDAEYVDTIRAGEFEAIDRAGYEQVMHGLMHAIQWNSRLDEFKSNHDTGGMTRAEMVQQARRLRMARTGSRESFVQFRFNEEFEAKQFAWRLAGEKYGFEKLGKSRLTAEEKQFHRKWTIWHYEKIQGD